MHTFHTKLFKYGEEIDKWLEALTPEHGTIKVIGYVGDAVRQCVTIEVWDHSKLVP